MTQFLSAQVRGHNNRLERANQLVSYLAQDSSQSVQEIQLAKLQNVWSDAWQNVPYYARLVRTGLCPKQFQSIDEFKNCVPITTKATIKQHPDEFVRGKKPDLQVATAGSTGAPLHIGLWKSEADVSASAIQAMRLYRGMDIRHDRLFLIWGHAHLLGKGWHKQVKKWQRVAKDNLLGYRRVDAYYMNSESCKLYFAEMMRFRPQIVCGYSNAVDMFVRHNIARREEARSLKLKFIVCTSEMLPKADSGDMIEDFFGAPLMMEYGAVDFGVVAHNWSGSNYLLNWWNYLGEVASLASETSGRFLVTTLYPRYTPLLRYDTGDDVEHPIYDSSGSIIAFAELLGRHHDVLQLPNGNSIHSMAVFHCIHQEDDVINIQLVKSHGRIDVLLVGHPDKEAHARIKQRLQILDSSLATCELTVVDDLITNSAGKRRWIIEQ